MRTFFIFNISNEMTILNKEHPLNLYKTMEQIYFLNPNEVNVGYKMFKSITNTINKKEMNLKLFAIHRYNHNYTKFNSKHMIHNYYTDENTELTINNAHLRLKTNAGKPIFFDDFRNEKNLFVCDFQNKDYFWMDRINY